MVPLLTQSLQPIVKLNGPRVAVGKKSAWNCWLRSTEKVGFQLIIDRRSALDTFSGDDGRNRPSPTYKYEPLLSKYSL